jgi:light-independent protochlorophyllide reductase subunit B
VISAPVHVQDFPARYSPVMGFEGANVLFDTLVHPLVMGLEEHLLAMFREDFEFHDEAGPSHHGGKAKRREEEGGQPPVAASGESPPDASGHEEGAGVALATPPARAEAQAAADVVTWLADAERELKKIPFFVRGKAKRNTERYAAERGVTEISVDTLYEAKAHYAR